MTKIFTPARARGIMAVRADAGGDINRVLASLATDFEAFKATLAEKDKEVAAKFDDVVTTDKLSKIDASVAELQASVDQANARIAASQMGGGGNDPVDRAYTEHWNAHFRSGDVHAALKKAPDSDGGFLAPVEWDRTVTDNLVEVSPMRQIASTQTISGAGFKKVFNQRGTGSGWVGETAPRPETSTPTLGTMSYPMGELYANPAISQQLLDDAEVNIEAWLADEVELTFAEQEGIAFVAGNGVNKPAGFLTYAEGALNATAHPFGAIPTLTTASATAITSDEIIDLIYSVPSAYVAGSRFAMSRLTMSVIRKLRDGQGNYIWQPSYAAGQPATLAMYPITELPAMPQVAAGALPIAFGDFKRGYLVIDRKGVTVLRDPFTNKPFVHFYTTKRVGGGLLNPQVLRVLKMAAA